MKHIDCLEVYVRVAKSTRDHGGYKEFPVALTDDHEGHRQRCFIDHRQGKVEVTLKILPNFDMHGASALHLGIHVPKPSSGKVSNKAFRYRVLHESERENGLMIIRHIRAEAHRMPHIDISKGSNTLTRSLGRY